MDQDFAHQAVLQAEVVTLFGAVPEGVVLDLTVGGAGHAAALLEAHHHLALVGVDRDPQAVEAARAVLAPFGSRAVVHQRAFATVVDDVEAWRAAGAPQWPQGAPRISGLLVDLGVSSPQLDRAERGFSYRRPGPLDMRMDPSAPLTAAQLVNTASAQDLARLFAENGEARLARRLARAIVAARPLSSTDQLAEVVAAAVPAPGRRRGHPARRVFQALRIAVNDELGQLETMLAPALELLAPGGRAVVISYHSGEDRLVKATFLAAERGSCQCPPGMPCLCGAPRRFRLLFRGTRRPTPAELAENPRAESARLRAIERLADGSPAPAGVR